MVHKTFKCSQAARHFCVLSVGVSAILSGSPVAAQEPAAEADPVEAPEEQAPDPEKPQEDNPPELLPQKMKDKEGAAPGSQLTLRELGEKSSAYVEEKDAEEAARLDEQRKARAREEEKVRRSAERAAAFDERAGYIPGYKRGLNLSLDPQNPRAPATPGGLTIPYHAPAEDDDWEFKYTGFASASLRASSGRRSDPTDEQSRVTLHTDPRIVDFYGAFQGTNVTPGSWVDLHLQYGNRTVTSHVNITTWKPERAAAYTDIRSQNLVAQAYLVFSVPVSTDLEFDWTVGSFRNQYGGLGQYGAGHYNTIMIGQIAGVGEHLAARYRLSPDYTLHVEHGFMGNFGKPPEGSGPSPFDNAQHPSEPSSWTHHAHVGFETHGELPFIFALHYLTNWAQDERDQLDNPATYFTDERFRPDGRLSIFGADVRMINNHYGDFAVAVAHAKARDVELLEGLGFFGAVNGDELTRRYFGPIGGGNGTMTAVGAEYNLSWAKLLHHPEPFWGEGPDLITSVFSNAAFIHESEDPFMRGRQMFKAGTEVTYRFFPWLGVSGRYDHVIPNSKDKEETFDVISPKLLFRTRWITHEQITLSYARWFYGENTHAEAPLEFPREELDNQMFALHFGMWW